MKGEAAAKDHGSDRGSDCGKEREAKAVEGRVNLDARDAWFARKAREEKNWNDLDKWFYRRMEKEENWAACQRWKSGGPSLEK